jgi:phosphotransferase system, enzyme I, PtsP
MPSSSSTLGRALHCDPLGAGLRFAAVATRAGKSAKGVVGRVSRADRRQTLRVLEDVSELATRGGDLDERLQRIVEIIATRTRSDVCSIYLLDGKGDTLTLRATTGLDRSTVGKVSMSVGEGLSGMVMEKREPVLVDDAMQHPRYKYFPETGEERYHSFAGVPVVDGDRPVGVLVVQTLRPRRFTTNESRLLKAIARQLAGAIVQARLVADLKASEQERREYRSRMNSALKRLEAHERTIGTGRRPRRGSKARLDGLPAAPGFGRGVAHLLTPPVTFESVPEQRAPARAKTRELARFQAALATARAQVATLRERLVERLPEFDADIVEAHRMMLDDEGLGRRVEALIRDGWTAEYSLRLVVEEYLAAFSQMKDDYLRERSADVKDVGLRVLRNLLGVDERERSFDSDTVLVAEEVTVSDLVLLDHADLRGLVLATGGLTSHATILAKSFEIPTVVGAAGATEVVHEGDDLLVDGNAGVVLVNPPADIRREYSRLDREYRAFNRELDALHDLPGETTDGKRIRLFANIGLIADLPMLQRHGADGVGLYRTEFPFLTYREFPTEEEQLALYSRVVRALEGRPVTIRTLDVGADKYPEYLHFAHEENPFLGWRSIRVSLETPALFKAQLRAIYRVGVLGPVRIMLPMISGLEELRRSRELIDEVQVELAREGLDFDPTIPVGIMIEVPSAVALATQLIREVDFFSIGTNDLIQYLLAVDRNNYKVASLYQPLHPAVLKAIRDTVQAARSAGKWVGLCGEMASDPLSALVLVGIGVDDLSMGPFYVPLMKRLIRSISLAETQEVATEALRKTTVKEVKGFLFDVMKQAGLVDLMEVYH